MHCRIYYISVSIHTSWYRVKSSRSNFLITVITPVLSPIANCLRSFPDTIEYVTGSFSGSTAWKKVTQRMKSILLRIAAKIRNCINCGCESDCDCETSGMHACVRMCVHACVCVCVCVNWIICNRRWESTYSNSDYCWIDGRSFTDLHFIYWAFKHRTSSIRTRDYCDLYNCLRIFSTTISSLQGN